MCDFTSSDVDRDALKYLVFDFNSSMELTRRLLVEKVFSITNEKIFWDFGTRKNWLEYISSIFDQQFSLMDANIWYVIGICVYLVYAYEASLENLSLLIPLAGGCSRK